VFPAASKPGWHGRTSFGGIDALADRVIRLVHMDAEPTKRLFHLHLQDFKLAVDCPLEFPNQGSKSSQRRDSTSNHPSPCRKPEDMAVLRTQPSVLNQLRPPLDQPLLQLSMLEE
jgi:hypothetical protein